MKTKMKTRIVRYILLAILCGALTLIRMTNDAYAAPAARSDGTAFVMLNTQDMASMHRAIELVRDHGGEVLQVYPPDAFVALLTPEIEQALAQDSAVRGIEKNALASAQAERLGENMQNAAHIWNTVFRDIPDPISAANVPGPIPEQHGSDALIPPSGEKAARSQANAPSATQTSEFMAGTIVYSIMFVESNGGAGNCSPADTQTENWSAKRRATVLSEISQGMAFWTARAKRPAPLTFMLDNLGVQTTSCEPITRSFGDRGKWLADVLTAYGYPATPNDYRVAARTLVNDRRTALGAHWGFLIVVVDSLNDADGSYLGGGSAFAEFNGPIQYLTYDNGGWGPSRMNLTAAHETGHIFGALDEYTASGCSTADHWGYLDVRNTSCNNGGITSDVSIMGEGSELDKPNVDVSTSARGAIGWRNPSGKIVDVVRTSQVALTPFLPDPTTDTTPTYSGSASNQPFPPGGCNTLAGICYRTPEPVTISRVKRVLWKLDKGDYKRKGLVPSDGKFDQETDEAFTLTPTSPVAPGKHTFRVQVINNFGHKSAVAKDTLTIQ